MLHHISLLPIDHSSSQQSLKEVDRLGPAEPIDAHYLTSIREELAAAARVMSPPLTASSSVTEHDISIPLRDGTRSASILVCPKSKPPSGSPLHVQYFGGGFIVGTPRLELVFARAVAERCGATVLLPNYRLAPRHKFAVTVHDCWDALQWAASHAEELGADLTQGFVVGGTSAGAQLATVVAHIAKDEKLTPLPTGMWLSIPRGLDEGSLPAKYKDVWLSMDQCVEAPVFSTKTMQSIEKIVKADPKSELYSVFNRHSGLANLPRAFIEVAGLDPLRDSGLVLERELRSNGVETKLEVHAGMAHGAWIFYPQLEVSKGIVERGLQGAEWLLKRRALVDESSREPVQETYIV
jgi:acetyl esterase/lipase